MRIWAIQYALILSFSVSIVIQNLAASFSPLSSHHCHAQTKMLFVADLVCFVSSLCEVDDIFSWWLLTLFSKEVLEVIHELKWQTVSYCISLFRNIIGFWKADNKNLYGNDLLRSKMRGQLNIFVFGISQNPSITRFCAVIIYDISYIILNIFLGLNPAWFYTK